MEALKLVGDANLSGGLHHKLVEALTTDDTSTAAPVRQHHSTVLRHRMGSQEFHQVRHIREDPYSPIRKFFRRWFET